MKVSKPLPKLPSMVESADVVSPNNIIFSAFSRENIHGQVVRVPTYCFPSNWVWLCFNLSGSSRFGREYFLFVNFTQNLSVRKSWKITFQANLTIQERCWSRSWWMSLWLRQEHPRRMLWVVSVPGIGIYRKLWLTIEVSDNIWVKTSSENGAKGQFW